MDVGVPGVVVTEIIVNRNPATRVSSSMREMGRGSDGWEHINEEIEATRPATREISLPRKREDARYHTNRWKKLAKAILRRDNGVCQVVPGCQTRATIADHIVEVYPGMPDSEFFAPTNLRAACRYHNYARGVVARHDREIRSIKDRPTAVVTKDYTR